MKIYLAGTSWPDILSYVKKKYPDIGILCSYANPNYFRKIIALGFENIILDSGAYTAYTQGKKIILEDLISFVLEQQKDKKFLSVSLDVLGDPLKSYDNWYRMTKEGIYCLPVFHVGEDYKYLDKYCNETDYVGIGGLAVQKGLNYKALRPILEYIKRKYPEHKFHIFGINNWRIFRNISFYSCDSTSWLSAAQYRQLILPNGSSVDLKKDIYQIKEYLESFGIDETNIRQSNINTKLSEINIDNLYKLLSSIKTPLIVYNKRLF